MIQFCNQKFHFCQPTKLIEQSIVMGLSVVIYCVIGVNIMIITVCIRAETNTTDICKYLNTNYAIRLFVRNVWVHWGFLHHKFTYPSPPHAHCTVMVIIIVNIINFTMYMVG